MRYVLAVVLAATLPAHGEDFRSKAPITVQGTDPFQRIELPFEAYRDTRRDLGDLRVLNAKGEAVPLAFVGEAVPEREKPVNVRLPQFAATTLAPTAATSGKVEIHVRTAADGTLRYVESRSANRAAAPVPRPAAYFLDASKVEFPVGALVFDWEAKPGSEIVKVNVEASDDLRDWRTVASRAALVRLEQAGQSLAQDHVPLRGVKAKYYRITWDGTPFALKSVDAESAPKDARREEPRKVATANATKTKEGDFVYDLGARLPVESIRVVFPEVNSVAPFDVAVRDSKEGPWRTVTSATFYRISRGGAEIASQPLDLGVQPAREWRLHPQVKSAGDGQPPRLEAQWRPAELVFVAKGEGPFSLAFGDKDARATSIPVSNLIPNYERGAERKLAIATVGPVTTSPPPAPPMQLFGQSPKKLALWAVLVGAVAVLAFMAYRLKGQMK
jgi:hypothetical protein